MKNRIKLLALLLCAAAILMCIPVQAAGAMDVTRDCSLTVNYKDKEDGSPIAGARFDIFRVAQPVSGGYELCGDFAGLPISLDDLDSETMLLLAGTFESFIDLEKIAPLASGLTDANGLLLFEDLQPGLYLVRGHSHSQNGKTYTTKPFLVFLPTVVDGEWVYDLTVVPKPESEPDTPGGTVERKVLKVWNDDGSEATRPDSITVHLLRNGEIYDTVVLSEENNWRYSWTDLPDDYYWTVAEDVPGEYTMTVSLEGITFVITNTRPPEETPPPSPPPSTPPSPPPSEPPGTPPPSPPPSEPPGTPPPNIPQTGQLWWPVPLLAVAGMLVFLVGYIRNRSCEDED